MKKFTSATQKKGELGESIACRYLVSQGYEIVERNFTRKWGEIDIVAKRHQTFHFIEVKSVSCENPNILPEEQVHSSKLGKLKRVVESYLRKHKTGKWQFDVACVYLNMESRRAKIKMLEDIILV